MCRPFPWAVGVAAASRWQRPPASPALVEWLAVLGCFLQVVQVARRQGPAGSRFSGLGRLGLRGFGLIPVSPGPGPAVRTALLVPVGAPDGGTRWRAGPLIRVVFGPSVPRSGCGPSPTPGLTGHWPPGGSRAVGPRWLTGRQSRAAHGLSVLAGARAVSGSRAVRSKWHTDRQLPPAHGSSAAHGPSGSSGTRAVNTRWRTGRQSARGSRAVSPHVAHGPSVHGWRTGRQSP